MRHKDGCLFYYENSSKKFKLDEELILGLEGCEIEKGMGDGFERKWDGDREIVQVLLMPGENRLVNVIRSEDKKDREITCKAEFSFYVGRI
jgi:hypothetical protein